jgi:hypothetical protein
MNLSERPLVMYTNGLQAIADQQQISIPEATIFALNDIRAQKKEKELSFVLDAAQLLDPGILYTQGLRKLAGTTPVLRISTLAAISNLNQVHAEEHISPTKQAFTWLTGQQIDLKG